MSLDGGRLEFWRGRRVLVTGHTGFKGSWLTFWLSELGAEVIGYALPPTSEPNLYELLGLSERCTSILADLDDGEAMNQTIKTSRPEVVIHMAAQALVRPSYADPLTTWRTNVLGVVRLLDLVRETPSVKSVVIVTSDKCYENVEQIWGYREDDALGGHDPYSASKGAAEIAARSMQRSFFRPFVTDGHPARIATVRAGNVIGGGDWSAARLVPDIVRGCLQGDGEVVLRNPGAVRPWQHVLDPLGAYLLIAERLSTMPEGVDGAFNIGPANSDVRPVAEVAAALVEALGRGHMVHAATPASLHEAKLLMLDSTKAHVVLGWQPGLSFIDCVKWTARWYGDWAKGADPIQLTREQLQQYMNRAV